MLPSLKRNAYLPSVFDGLFGDKLLDNIWNYNESASIPSVNIIEGKDEIRIEVAAPGLQKDDFKLNLDNDVLTISSEKEVSNEKNEERFVRREFSYSSFRRTFVLPETVNTEKINAVHKDGILVIHMPKKEEAVTKAPRDIRIS